MLEEKLAILRKAILAENPSPALKFAAMYFMAEYSREDLPDWVEALANGNLDLWELVIEIVRGEMTEEIILSIGSAKTTTEGGRAEISKNATISIGYEKTPKKG